MAELKLQDVATYQDVADLIKAFGENVRAIKAELQASYQTSLDSSLANAATSLEAKLKPDTEPLNRQIRALEAGLASLERALNGKPGSGDITTAVAGISRDVRNETASVAKLIAAIGKRITSIERKDLDYRITALENEEAAEPAEAETPESIRNKLESLKGTPSALAIDAIFGLADRLDQLTRDVSRKSQGGGSVIAYSRGAVKLYDLSDQLDGVKKTFAMPAFWRVISIQSTSSPTTFRPTVDYTVDGNAMTVAFTSQVDAASTLSAGQTLTVIYAEA